MLPGLPFQEAPVELIDALKGDGAAFFGAEQDGDFLPRIVEGPGPFVMTTEIN